MEMQTIKQTLFSGWHFMRWLRLIVGIIFIAQAVQMHDWLVGTVAAFFLVTAIRNTGCCSGNACAVPQRKQHGKEAKTFDETKK